MSRLTEKVNYGSSWVETIETDEYIPLNYSSDTTIGKCVDKLGKLEDLEEQLGCPLEVVFKALQNGIYTNVYSGLCYVGLYENYFQVSDDYVVYLKDYKHTWWLKEDKSE